MREHKYAVREELNGRWTVHRVMDYDAMGLWEEIGWYRREYDAVMRANIKSKKMKMQRQFERPRTIGSIILYDSC